MEYTETFNKFKTKQVLTGRKTEEEASADYADFRRFFSGDAVGIRGDSGRVPQDFANLTGCDG